MSLSDWLSIPSRFGQPYMLTLSEFLFICPRGCTLVQSGRVCMYVCRLGQQRIRFKFLWWVQVFNLTKLFWVIGNMPIKNYMFMVVLWTSRAANYLIQYFRNALKNKGKHAYIMWAFWYLSCSTKKKKSVFAMRPLGTAKGLFGYMMLNFSTIFLIKL